MRLVAFLFAAAIGTGLLTTRANSSEPSGIVGIYAIVQRVELEPNEVAPEGIRIWGAFAFVNGGSGNPADITAAKRGQLYFHLPVLPMATPAVAAAMRKEWADIKTVAGTGQAIAFGGWRYGGMFSASVAAPGGFGVAEDGTGTPINTWILADTTRSARAVAYTTNVGVVKLSESGGFADVIGRLKAVLR